MSSPPTTTSISAGTRTASSKASSAAISPKSARPACSTTSHSRMSTTRKWDLRGTPSVCVHCGLGCNTTPNERYGKARRILNRYNGEVNGYFLCDRGRFGYDFVNSTLRVRQPLLRRNGSGKPEPATKGEALRHLTELLSSGKVIGIGSPRASLEANFALRELVGAERFHLGLSASEQELLALIIDILQRGPARAASLKDAEQADAVLVLGEDVPNTAPRLALSLRQAVRQKSLEIADRMNIPRWQDAAVRNAAQQERSPLFIATPDATRLDDVATRAFRAAPTDLARLGFAVAHELDAAAARGSRSSGRRSRACATNRRRAQEREAPARCGRHRMRQRGRDPGRGQRGLGALPEWSFRGAVLRGARVQQPGARPHRRWHAARRLRGGRTGRRRDGHRARKRPLSTRRARGRRSLPGSRAPRRRDRPPAARDRCGTRRSCCPPARSPRPMAPW